MHLHSLITVIWCNWLLSHTLASDILPVGDDFSSVENMTPFTKRQDSEEDQPPLAWIKKWAAIGDSYAAGIGAGERIDYDCSRYNYAYPNLLNIDDAFSGDQEFTYLACSGAESPGIQIQAEMLSGEQDAITVSSGGNDVELVKILNYCVFAFLPHWTWVLWGCAWQVAKSSQLIQNTLPGNLDKVYSAAKAKLSSRGKLYITAYGRFFDEESNECDSVSLAWYSKLGADPIWLTQELRSALNGLVDEVNEQIRQAVQRAGDRVVMVEWDRYSGLLEGRYCQPGVSEPQPNRQGLLFYLDGADEDAFASDVSPRAGNGTQNGDYPSSTIEGQIVAMFREGREHVVESGVDPASVEIRSSAPDGWARVFHPTRLGHTLIASKVLWHMIIEGAGDNELATRDENICATKERLPGNINVNLGNDLPADFPKAFTYEDGFQHPSYILTGRMSERMCAGVCGASNLESIPSQFVRAVSYGENGGCEYSVKIGLRHEMYVFASESGDSCWTATDKLVSAQGTKDSAWINGLNKDEFYQMGVRPINSKGPAGITHEPFDLSTNDHLGYLHISCRRSDSTATSYHFEVRLAEFDNRWALQYELNQCQGGAEVYEWGADANEYHFPSDNIRSTIYVHFELSYFISTRCGEKALEKVLGLGEGSVQCPGRNAEFKETILIPG